MPRRRTVRRRQRGGKSEIVEEIQFPNRETLRAGFKDTEVKGQKLPLAETQEQPLVFWKGPPVGELRTFLCIDPDASAKSWLHWMFTNCKGVDPSSGDEIVSWAPPSPPKRSGTHTYYFMTFSHVFPITVPSPAQRGYFKVKEFADKYGLTPVSVASFQTAAQAGGRKKV